MRRAFLLTIAVYATSIAVASALLPARVPLHFAGSGEPDRWGSRAEAVLTFWSDRRRAGAAPGRLGRADGPAAAALRDWSTSRTRTGGWPRPSGRRRRGAGCAPTCTAWRAVTMAFLVGVLGVTVAAARSDDPSLGWPFMVAVGACVVAVVLWTIWVSVARYRPVEGR